jgi:peptidyl-dipeptidase Dcp
MNKCTLQARVGRLAGMSVSLTIIVVASANICGQEKNGEPVEMTAMLQPWTGPYGGVPPWHLVRPDEFVKAFDAAIAISEEEIDAIANNPDPPTFDNTVVALESAGRTLDRLQSLFDVHRSNLSVGPVPDVERVVVPKLAEYEDRVTQNEKLFARIAAVYESEATTENLSLAQKRLLEDRYKKFVRRTCWPTSKTT